MSTSLKSMPTKLLAIADLIAAGRIADVAYVAVTVSGETIQGFSISEPARPDALVGGLNETAEWAGSIEKNEAIAKARAEMAG